LLDTAKEKIKNHISKIVFIICILQPILDVVSFWSTKLSLPNALTLGIRLIMMAFIFVTAFILAEKRRVYCLMILTLSLLGIGHILVCHANGYSDIIGDITNLIRIYHFPIFSICFITFLKKEPRVYRSILKGFTASFLIIIAVMLLSTLTSTDPHTYQNKGIGTLGWFYFANTQSAVISVLAAIYVCMTVKKFKDSFLVLLLHLIPAMAVLYLFATRLTYISLLMIGIGTAITLIITDRKQKKAIAVLCIVTVIFIALLPLSPMYKNQQKVSDNLTKEQAKVDRLIEKYEYKAIKKGFTGKELKIARLEGAYREHLNGLVERFGLEKTVEFYKYTEDASILHHYRTMKLSYNELLMEEYGVSSRFFGLELADLTSAGIIHDVENDFHGIYYLMGAISLILLIVFIAYFILLIIKSLIHDFKNTFTLEAASWGIALISLLLHVYATAGVLRRPNGSFYLSVVLAVVYYLTKLRKSTDDDERTN